MMETIWALGEPGQHLALPVKRIIEASGGITLSTVRGFAESGVERISTGELTHSVRSLDLSLRCEPQR